MIKKILLPTLILYLIVLTMPQLSWSQSDSNIKVSRWVLSRNNKYNLTAVDTLERGMHGYSISGKSVGKKLSAPMHKSWERVLQLTEQLAPSKKLMGCAAGNFEITYQKTSQGLPNKFFGCITDEKYAEIYYELRKIKRQAL